MAVGLAHGDQDSEVKELVNRAQQVAAAIQIES